MLPEVLFMAPDKRLLFRVCRYEKAAPGQHPSSQTSTERHHRVKA